MKSYKYSFLFPLLIIFQIFLAPDEISHFDVKDKIESGAGVMAVLVSSASGSEECPKLLKVFPYSILQSYDKKKSLVTSSSSSSVPDFLSHIILGIYILENSARAPPLKSFRSLS